MGANVDLDLMFCDDLFMDVLRRLEVWGACYTEKAGTFPVHGIGPQCGITQPSPPSPPLNFLVGVAVYFEPKFLLKIKYINYSLFTFWIHLCLHAPPSLIKNDVVPVPTLEQFTITDWSKVSYREMMIETSLRLPSYNLIVTLNTWIRGQDTTEI